MPFATGLDVQPEGALCSNCTLSGCAFVGSEGPQEAALVLVGEAPGNQEVMYGRPFVGRAGKLLNQALVEAGIDRDECFITNSVLCHPKENRKPNRAELVCCRGRLIREITARKPRVVVLLGASAIESILGRIKYRPKKKVYEIEAAPRVSEVRGTVLQSEELGCRVVPTWHPAAVLRNPQLYRDLVNDLKLAVSLLNGRPRNGVELVWKLVETPEDIEDLAAALDSKRLSNALYTIAVDFETDQAGRPLCLGIGWWSGPQEITVSIVPGSTLLESRRLRDALHGLYIVAHDAKFDCQVFWDYGIPVLPGDDTMLLHMLVDERSGTHSLENVVRQLYPDHPDLQRWAGFKKLRNRLAELPFDQVAWYNAMDVYFTLCADRDLKKQIDEDGHRAYNTLLKPAILPLAWMEYTGVHIDLVRMDGLDEEFESRIADVEGRMFKVLADAGHVLDRSDFNPNAPAKVAWVMYDLLGLPDPSGKRSTDKEVLKKLEGSHEFPSLMLEYRRLQKFKSTYIDNIRKKVQESRDGRLHGRFNLHGTTTGRLSSSSPNLQNIPKHGGEEAKLVRDCFIATPGYTLVEADLSQAELRVLGYFSRDQNLLEAIHSGIDLHKATAMRMFGVPEEQVTKEMRSVAKTLNFAILYGAGADKVAETIVKTLGIQISKEEAQQAIDQWFATFPGVLDWITSVRTEAIRTGQVRTPLGRVRRWPIVDDAALREAVNFPIQSLASDITLLSLIRLFSALPETDRLLLTIHDAIVLETCRDPLEVARQVRDTMLTVAHEVVEGVVPFDIEVSVGERWGSLEVVHL